MCDDGKHGHLAKVAACAAILKAAKVGEFIQIAAAELAYKKALKLAHRAGSLAVIEYMLRRKPSLEAAESFANAAKTHYDSKYVDAAVKLTGPHVDNVYRLMKSAMVRRLNGKIKGEFVYEHTAALNKVETPDPPRIDLVFYVADERAIEQLTSGFYFWFAENYDLNISEAVKSVVGSEVIREGKKWIDVVDDLEKALKRELGVIGGGRTLSVPAGWRGTYEEYFEALAASITTTARVASSTKAMSEFRAPEIIIVNPMDERTCPRCAVMNGKRFPLEAAEAQLEKLYKARTREEVVEAQPWYSTKEFLRLNSTPGSVSAAQTTRLTEASVILPPYHFRCRCTIDIAPGTEIE